PRRSRRRRGAGPGAIPRATSRGSRRAPWPSALAPFRCRAVEPALAIPRAYRVTVDVVVETLPQLVILPQLPPAFGAVADDAGLGRVDKGEAVHGDAHHSTSPTARASTRRTSS